LNVGVAVEQLDHADHAGGRLAESTPPATAPFNAAQTLVTVPRMFVHTVYFWLHPSADDETRRQLINDCEQLLGKIPTVRHLWSGKPAMTPRDIVDNSYDVGLCVVLDDAKGHDVYQTHPVHADFIARNKQHWKRVQVYDFQHGS
jgi:hypothetical protein